MVWLKMQTLKPSTPLSDFLSFLRDVAEKYRIAEAEQQETEAETQDILHDLELNQHDYYETAQLAKDLREIRKKRRVAKNTIETLTPIVQYVDANRDHVRDIEKLLGEVRRVEGRVSNRAYMPRVRDFQKIEHVNAGVGNVVEMVDVVEKPKAEKKAKAVKEDKLPAVVRRMKEKLGDG